MSDIPTLAPIPVAILERLSAVPVPMGEGRKPDGAGWQGAPGQSQFITYGVLYPLNHERASSNASIGNRYTHPTTRWQITTVGQNQHAASVAADLFVAAICNREPLDIADMATVMLVSDGSFPAERDESVNPPLFMAVERFRLDTQTQ